MNMKKLSLNLAKTWSIINDNWYRDFAAYGEDTKKLPSLKNTEDMYNNENPNKMKNLEQIQTQIDQLQAELDQLKQVKQSKPKVGRFVPEVGEWYWYCAGDGGVYKVENNNYPYENCIFDIQIGNCFETEQEAQTHIDKLIFITQVQDWLDVQNDGWVADWGDDNENKWLLIYNWNKGKLESTCYRYIQSTASHKHTKSKQIILDMIEKFDNQKLKDWWI